MCTLVAMHRWDPEASWIHAANRDEYLDRPPGPSGRRAWETSDSSFTPLLRALPYWRGIDVGEQTARTIR